jgi:hypothetical protein
MPGTDGPRTDTADRTAGNPGSATGENLPCSCSSLWERMAPLIAPSRPRRPRQRLPCGAGRAPHTDESGREGGRLQMEGDRDGDDNNFLCELTIASRRDACAYRSSTGATRSNGVH